MTRRKERMKKSKKEMLNQWKKEKKLRDFIDSQSEREWASEST